MDGRQGGFTLVEVVIAIGLFTFCVIAMVGLLQVALSSTRDAQTDSAIAGLMGNLSAKLDSLSESQLAGLQSSNRFFDAVGGPLEQGNDPAAYFRVRFEPVSASAVNETFALTNAPDFHVWTVAVDYPAPGFARSKQFPIGTRAW